MIKKSRERALELGCLDKSELYQLDAFKLGTLNSKPSVYITGFFLSHLTIKQEINFFALLKDNMVKGGKIIVLDSTWSDIRKKVRVKEGKQMRTLNDGSKYEIYKKYFTVTELEQIAEREHLSLNLAFFGKIFFAAVYQF